MPTSSPIPARRPTWPLYFALLEPGDTVLGMSLAHGGHLTHGSPGQHLGQAITTSYPTAWIDETGYIDYDKVHEHRPWRSSPKLIVAGASRLCRG